MWRKCSGGLEDSLTDEYISLSWISLQQLFVNPSRLKSFKLQAAKLQISDQNFGFLEYFSNLRFNLPFHSPWQTRTVQNYPKWQKKSPKRNSKKCNLDEMDEKFLKTHGKMTEDRGKKLCLLQHGMKCTKKWIKLIKNLQNLDAQSKNR